MNKLPLLGFLLLAATTLSAQNQAKKYVLLEHFTNSKCSICASKNPAFYSLIGQPQYAPDIHHVSIHPSVPYNTCVFYLANTTENNAWASIYTIQGTPQLAINGKLLTPGSQLLRQDTLVKYINQTSPLALKVTESGSGSSRTATIEASALSQIPAGNYKLHVAVLEKTINQTTPNGESVHHDVFRDMLTPVTGQDFIAPAPGQSLTVNFDYTINAAWNANEIYVLAFVKETGSKQVLNSGTKFDPVLVSANEAQTKRLQFSPNPATDVTFARLQDDVAVQTRVFDMKGSQVYHNREALTENVSIPMAELNKGVYFVEIIGQNAVYTSKLIKE